jgi:VTC domain
VAKLLLLVFPAPARPALCTSFNYQMNLAILWMCSSSKRSHLDEHTSQEAGASRAEDEWCCGDSVPLPHGDRQRFPYAVVEIKLQGVGQPAWIRRLVDSGGQHYLWLMTRWAAMVLYTFRNAEVMCCCCCALSKHINLCG